MAERPAAFDGTAPSALALSIISLLFIIAGLALDGTPRTVALSVLSVGMTGALVAVGTRIGKNLQ